MDRRRPAAALGAACLAVALAGAPAADARPMGADRGFSGIEFPVLSELPPLPADGNGHDPTGAPEPSDSAVSGVQTVALVLAGSVLIAGGLGLALVTRRGRGDEPEEPADRPDRTEPGPPR